MRFLILFGCISFLNFGFISLSSCVFHLGNGPSTNSSETSCQQTKVETIEKKSPLFFACISFSVPEESWKQISHHLEKIGGEFVLKGFPNNSFEDFLKKVMDMRQKGILAPITIDPSLFEEYNIETVPTFILVKEEGFKKVVGNVSVPYALEEMGGL